MQASAVLSGDSVSVRLVLGQHLEGLTVLTDEALDALGELRVHPGVSDARSRRSIDSQQATTKERDPPPQSKSA